MPGPWDKYQSQTMAQPSPDGLLAPGNIDIHHRPVAHNPDGSISTVRSISVDEDGKSYLIPTVSPDGRVLSDQDAINLFHQTGQHLGVFKSWQQADAYAQNLHEQQAQEYEPQSGRAGPWAKYGGQSGATTTPSQGRPSGDGVTLSDLITGHRPEPTVGQQLGRAFTMAGRNVAQGVMSIPGLINDPIVATLNYGEQKLGIDPKYRFGTAAQATDAALNAAGVPDYKPQNGTERVVGRVEQGIGGLAAGNALGGLLGGTGNQVARGVGNALQASQGSQLAATAAGTGAGGIAHELGASPGTELAVSLLGGAAPAALEGGAAGLARGSARLLGSPDAQTSRLASIAQAEGIPLKASQVSDSRVAKLLDSATGQVPFSGAQKFQGGQQAAFNRAVGKTIGVDADAITPQVFSKAKQAIGDKFNQLTQQNNLAIDPPLVQKLNQIRADAGAYYGKDAQSMVDTIINRIVDQSQNSTLPGRVYQSIDSALGKAARAGGEKSVPLSDLRETLRDAMDSSIRPEDAQAWAQARQQYRDLKTIEPLVAEASATGGNISASKLMGRVIADKSGKSAVAQGKRGQLADLAAIGQRFIKEPVQDSGTARRTAVVDALKGAGTVAGSALGAGTAINPLAGLTAAGGAVALSRQVQKIMQSPRLVNTLLQNPNLNPQLRAALEASISPTTQSLLQQGH